MASAVVGGLFIIASAEEYEFVVEFSPVAILAAVVSWAGRPVCSGFRCGGFIRCGLIHLGVRSVISSGWD